MSASIARYLKDFGTPPPPVLADDFDMFTSEMAEDFSLPAEEPVDIETERTEAHARGRQEATEELERRWAEERAALVEAHRLEMAALQTRLESELAEKIAARLEAFAMSTARGVADQTARVLAPLVEEVIAERAIADLVELVRSAILEGEVEAITVRGPTPMFEKLRTLLGDGAAIVRHVETADIDLTVELGDASLITRMSAWSASLKKVMG